MRLLSDDGIINNVDLGSERTYITTNKSERMGTFDVGALLEAQALETLQEVTETVEKIENPNRPDPLREYDHEVTMAYRDGFEQARQSILEAIKQLKGEG